MRGEQGYSHNMLIESFRCSNLLIVLKSRTVVDLFSSLWVPILTMILLSILPLFICVQTTLSSAALSFLLCLLRFPALIQSSFSVYIRFLVLQLVLVLFSKFSSLVFLDTPHFLLSLLFCRVHYYWVYDSFLYIHLILFCEMSTFQKFLVSNALFAAIIFSLISISLLPS